MSVNDTQFGGSHYKRAIQHWDYAKQLPYLDGQVSKYVDRHRQKNGAEDLKKAMHYLQKIMEDEYQMEVSITYGDGASRGGASQTMLEDYKNAQRHPL